MTPPMPRYTPRAVATHSMVMNRAKNSSDEPRSFSKNMTTREKLQARTMGPRWRISGSHIPATWWVPIDSSSRFSTR